MIFMHRKSTPFVWVYAGLLYGGAMASSAMAVQHYKMDASHTAFTFRVQHLGMSYTYGRFNVVEGQFTAKEADGSLTAITVTVKSGSVDTGFPKRDDHLRSPDFFNAKQFPEITFRSRSVEATAEGYRVVGDLVLHGVKQSITIDLRKMGEGKDPWGNYRMGFATELVLKRSDYDMNQMMAAVGDEVELMISFEGLRQ